MLYWELDICRGGWNNTLERKEEIDKVSKLKGVLNMGLFDKFKKESIQSTENTKHYDNELLEIVRIVSFNHEDAIKSAQDCIENSISNPIEYYKNHIDDYEECDIPDPEELSFLQLMDCVDILMNYGYVCECDWKETKEEFLFQISTLKGMRSLMLNIKNKWLDEKQDIPVWCTVLDEKWKKSNSVIGAFDTDSDSYVMFLCKREDLETLSVLAEKSGYRIDYAKNM